MMPSPTIAGLLDAACRELQRCSESPRLDAQLLLGKVQGCSRADLIAHGDEPVAAAHRDAFARLLVQRRCGTPVAYLTGTREFWSMPLIVTPAVLVPRAETETLVELALRHMPPEYAGAVLDVGTGSGAIALAIASERPLARVTGTDISQQALDIASRNSANLGLTRVVWRRGVWFEPVPNERFDLIVANPPYIAAADPALAALAAEPLIALTPGATGLEAFHAIIGGAARHLHAAGLLLLEHGCDQAADVAAIFARHGFTDVRSQLDRAGLPRVALGSIHSPT